MREIRVVDDNGQPIAGALVVSEQLPYIATKWRLAVSTSDTDGYVGVVNTRGSIVAPGYYPVIDSNDIGSERSWSARARLDQTTVLFPVRTESNHEVSVRDHKAYSTADTKAYVFSEVACDNVQIEYFFDSSRIRAKSESRITPSERFYFLGPSNSAATNSLEGDGFISFYCAKSGSQNKIGIGATTRAWAHGNPRHTLTIFEAEDVKFTDYIQPLFGCMTKENFSWWGEMSDDAPMLTTNDTPTDFSVFVDASPECSRSRLNEFVAYFESLNSSNGDD